MRPPMEDFVDPSVLDGLLDDEQDENEPLQNGLKNGQKRKSLENDLNERNGKRPKLEKKTEKIELKGLLGNSLGSYWNDGSMMVEKRRRKQVIRFTQDDDKKDDDDDESPERRKRPRQDEKVNLKKRARQVKVEDSNVNPYQLFEANSTLDSTLNSSLDQTEINEEALVGSKKRKSHRPYSVNPISVACHMARKPVQNFNLCPYKQPSKLLKDCAQFLLKDHSSIPLVLALDVTELIHVTQYKAMLQNQKTTKFKRKKERPKDIDNLRPGYSRAKEDLKQFLCSVTVERSMHAQQRRNGLVDPEYQKAKKELHAFLEDFYKK